MGNANSGARPKPRALVALQGHQSHHVEKIEPPTRPDAPACPADMPEAGRKWWEHAVSILAYADLLSQRDLSILELAARHYVRWKRAEADVEQFGMIFESLVTMDKSGNIVDPDDPRARYGKTTRRENPACRVSSREAAAFERCIARLGFSPVDWARLAVPKGKRDPSGLLDVG